ncbi:MAG: enolase C-terminal domain-like protein [Caldilineaceae bacterium]
MKITNLTAFYPRYRQPLAGWRPQLWQIVVRVETDRGVVGWGYGGGGLSALPIINGHFRQLLVGRTLESRTDIMTLWDELYAASIPYGRKGVAIMALSGVDLALWDLLGQAERLPVYQLLGGQPRTRLRAYATGQESAWYAELGYTAHKFSHRWTGDPADYDQAVAHAELARTHFGQGALLMVDCYMSWDATVTTEMARRLAPYRLYWFEDLLTPDDLSGQAALRGELGSVLVAGGEHEFTHYGFQEVARQGALDLWQPDITWCGGITAGLRIVELAQQQQIPVVPHRGGEVWGLHLIAASACADLAEVLPGTRQAQPDPLWQDEPQVTAGYLTLSDAPGFGVTINEAMLSL